MQLVSPGTGWITRPQGLLWTNDNGVHWIDITPHQPPLPRGAMLTNVFFRDEFEGWAIVSYQEPIASPTQGARREPKTFYTLLHTRNSGQSWDATPLTYPPLPESMEDALAGPIELYFLDSKHGWLEFEIAGMSRPGMLLATEDGGHTWKWLNGKGSFFSGQILFTSLLDGWLVSYWDSRLYVTHDGAKSWQAVALIPPADLPESRYPRVFNLPMFKDSRNGYVPVDYAAREGTPWEVVVYATYSSGRSWQPLRTLSIPDYVPFALTDSAVILPTNSVRGKLSTESVSLSNQAQPAKPVTTQQASGVNLFSFLDARNGWALAFCGLYATADGGSTWKNISPPPTTPPPQEQITIIRQTPSGQVVTKAPPPLSPCAS
jgi:hypothetical protein